MRSRIETTTNPGFGIRWTAFVFHRGWIQAGSGVTAYEGQAQHEASKAISNFKAPRYARDGYSA